MSVTTEVFSVFGASGYLGDSWAKANPSTKALHRDELWAPDVAGVVDFSFPRNYQESEVWARYEDLMARRCRQLRANPLPYIYIGSMSSVGDPNSEYGQLKKLTEQRILSAGGMVVRFGLVTDKENPGGRYGELVDIARRLPLVICPASNSFSIMVTSLKESMIALETYSTANGNDVVAAGTRRSSLGLLLVDMCESGLVDRKYRELSPRTSRVAQSVAARIRIGKFDSLASIAREDTNGDR